MDKLSKILTIAVLSLTLILSQGGLVSAKEGDGDRNRVRIEVENENETREFRFEIKGNTFEIRDFITQVSTNSFTLAGRTVKIDPAVSARFKQEGVLATGAFARVEGVIVNNDFIARVIKIESRPAAQNQANQTHTMIEINNNRFEARGIVSNVSTSSFTLSSLTIRMDSSVTGKVDIKGNLTNGAFVKAEGKVQNNDLFAQEIRVGPENQGTGGQPVLVTSPNMIQRLIDLLQSLLARLQSR